MYKKEHGFSVVEGIIALAAILLLALFTVYFVNRQNGRLNPPAPAAATTATKPRVSTASDASKIQDLYTIQLAVEKYFNDGGQIVDNVPALPSSLSQVHIKGLKNSLSDYRYTVTQDDPHNSTTVSYRICTTFNTATPGKPHTGTADDISSYKWHKQGTQCYDNDIYKSGSHVSVSNKT